MLYVSANEKAVSLELHRYTEENAQIIEGRLEPWLKQYFEDAEPTVTDVWDRYIASMYWAFTTMTTVGRCTLCILLPTPPPFLIG